MYGEVVFNPSDLLITKPLPQDLELQFKNLGTEKEQMQEKLVMQFNQVFGTKIDPAKMTLTNKECE